MQQVTAATVINVGKVYSRPFWTVWKCINFVALWYTELTRLVLSGKPRDGLDQSKVYQNRDKVGVIGSTSAATIILPNAGNSQGDKELETRGGKNKRWWWIVEKAKDHARF